MIGKEIETSIPVKMNKQDVERLLKTNGKGSTITLDVEGTSYNVLIKDVIYNSLKGQLEEVDFQALVSNEEVHSTAAVEIINHEMVQEGALQEMLSEIAYKALPADLIDHVTVDVSGMKVGDTVYVKDLEIAKNPKIHLHTDPEAIVLTIDAIRNAVPEDEEADGEAAE